MRNEYRLLQLALLKKYLTNDFIEVLELYVVVTVLQTYVEVKSPAKLQKTEKCEARLNETMKKCYEVRVDCIITLLDTYR